jgi:outer membrane protein assembly factor BamA
LQIVKFTCAMKTLTLLSLLSLPLPGNPANSEKVQLVEIEGSNLSIDLATKAGTAFDPGLIRADVRKLYATGRFHDVIAIVKDHVEGKLVTFHVVPERARLLRQIHYEPADLPLNLAIAPGVPVDAKYIHQVTSTIHAQLARHGFTNPRIESEVKPVDARFADLWFHIERGEPVHVAEVKVAGTDGDNQSLSGLQSLKGRRILPPIPGLWKGWTMRPAFTYGSLDSDVSRLNSSYLRRGYFGAVVRTDRIEYKNGGANVYLFLQPGQKSEVRQWSVEGLGFDRRSEQVSGDFKPDKLCSCLFDLRRQSEKQGYLDFSVKLTLKSNDGGSDLIATVDRGVPYRVRTLNFRGNHKFSDRVLRANMLLDEMDLLDATRLRKSLARINQSRFFEPLDEHSVDVRTDAGSGMADVTIRVRERKPGSWLLSGPAGPMRVSGPFQFALASRLPSWGRGVLELSTYFASFSILAQADPISRAILGTTRTFVPVLAVQRSYNPGDGWKSGFGIAPQLGWRATAASYGMTQTRERLLPLLAGKKVYTSTLPITVEREQGDAVMYCEPKDSWKWARLGASTALQIATSFAPI